MLKNFIIVFIFLLYIPSTIYSAVNNQDENLCDKISQIHVIPFKNEHVDDTIYNGIMRFGEKAIPCLLDKVIDDTMMQDPRKAPPYDKITVGDVSLFILLNITGLGLEAILPEHLLSDFRRDGVYTYFKFVEEKENRKIIQAKLYELLNVPT